jgi:hypothetical protein
MRVTIEHTTKKVGMFKSAPALSLTVELTDVEKASIQRGGLAEYILFEKQLYSGIPERMQRAVLVSDVLPGTPYVWPYDNLAAARADEVKLREALKIFKDAIEQNATPLKNKDTFEL